MIIIVIAVLCFIFKLQGYSRKKQAPIYTRPTKPTAEQERRERMREKEKIRLQKELDRIARQQAREEQQQQKAQARRQQAQADIAFIMAQLDKVSELLNEADDELEAICKRIAIDEAMHKYDNATRDQKQRERIIKKVMQYETRIHNLESRLAKARFTAQADIAA